MIDIDYAVVKNTAEGIARDDVIEYLNKKVCELDAKTGPYSEERATAYTALCIAKISDIYADEGYRGYERAAKLFASRIIDRLPPSEDTGDLMRNVADIAEDIGFCMGLIRDALEWIQATRRLLAVDVVAKKFGGDALETEVWAKRAKDKDAPQRLDEEKTKAIVKLANNLTDAFQIRADAAVSLVYAGYLTPEDVNNATPEELEAVRGVGPSTMLIIKGPLAQ